VQACRRDPDKEFDTPHSVRSAATFGPPKGKCKPQTSQFLKSHFGPTKPGELRLDDIFFAMLIYCLADAPQNMLSKAETLNSSTVYQSFAFLGLSRLVMNPAVHYHYTYAHFGAPLLFILAARFIL